MEKKREREREENETERDEETGVDGRVCARLRTSVTGEKRPRPSVEAA